MGGFHLCRVEAAHFVSTPMEKGPHARGGGVTV
jgi:hypothetical protein